VNLRGEWTRRGEEANIKQVRPCSAAQELVPYNLQPPSFSCIVPFIFHLQGFATIKERATAFKTSKSIRPSARSTTGHFVDGDKLELPGEKSNLDILE
jgi:hypothetical protein